MLTEDHLEFYKEHGYVIVENVYNSEEVEKLRDDLHQHLLALDINHEKILNKEQIMEDGPRVKSRVANIFYGKWKIDAQLNEKVYEISKQLLINTYGAKIEDFDHIYENFDDVAPYFDRICYRLPDN